MRDLSQIEEMILWAVWRLQGNAYGVTLRESLAEATGRIIPYGTLYSALARLSRIGFVFRTTGDPTPKRGGRSKNYYRITPDGLSTLKEALELKKSLWDPKTESALTKAIV